METRRTPGQRAGLTRARVLAAARELHGERGLDALTMRALAERLQVAPNALYSHVPNKTALIDDLLDNVLGEVDEPTFGTGADGLHALMASTYRVLLRHPDLVPLYLARQGALGTNAHHLGEVMRALLAEAGVVGAPAREALRVLIVYTIGFAAFTAAEAVVLSAAELTANFQRGLRWLLAGITAG
ncbi:MAG: TetR/AcrR family transcriptional regulator [Actinomycetota bacterium]|nr:TetR/AcrR family transcriptional regulator [Actinomycetota bacterium]